MVCSKCGRDRVNPKGECLDCKLESLEKAARFILTSGLLYSGENNCAVKTSAINSLRQALNESFEDKVPSLEEKR